MKINFRNLPLFVMVVSISLFASCKDDDKDPQPNPVPTVLPKLSIEMDHLAGSEKFYLDSTYINANGDEITANLFKYYVSNIRLIKTDNSEVVIPNTYFLVNQDDETSMTLEMESLPVGLYKSIKFMIGVDSTRNVSGAQTGALDPANGMFWTWNTGYIFLKIEGTSPVIPTGGQNFTFHIGGFQGAYKNYREITLPFDGDILTLAYNKAPELHLVIDVLQIFKTPTTLDLSTFPNSVMGANANAETLANNYADMFRYDHLHED